MASFKNSARLLKERAALHTSHDEACVARHNWPAMRVFTQRTEKEKREGPAEGSFRLGCRTQLSRTIMIHLGRDIGIVTQMHPYPSLRRLSTNPVRDTIST